MQYSSTEGHHMNILSKGAAVGLAVVLGLGGALIATQSASAHTGDLKVNAVCNAATGEYDLTASLIITQTGETGSTIWKVGDSNFAGTPTNATKLPNGPVASNGAETITLTTFSLPGTTTGFGPWVYAFTTWTPDNFQKGSDGQLLKALSGDCAKPDPKDASYNLNVAAPNCTADGSASVTQLNFASLAAPLDTSVGPHTVTVTADAGHQFSDGTKTQTPNYTVLPKAHNAACVKAQPCTALGTATHESDDNAGVLEPDGWHLFSQGNNKATDVIFPASGNLQGLTNFNWAATGTVGNGIFVRFIVDLSADGGSTYNSLSITDTTVTQASVANVGSKGLFLGKTVAQIADLYPEAVYHAISFQTGSSYAKGDGAVLTGITDGDCSKSFTTTQPEPKTRQTVVTTPVVCSVDGGGTSTTTTTNFETDYVWDTKTATYVLGEEFVVGEPLVVTNEIGTDVCPAVIDITVVFPTQTDLCGTTEDARQDAVDTDSYTITTTVNADGSADYQAVARQGFVFAEGAVTTAHLDALTDVACPLNLPPTTVQALATTGVPIYGTILLIVLLIGTGVVVRTRRQATK